MNIHNILLALLIGLSFATIFFFAKAIKKQDWGNILQPSIALLIALVGWIYFSSPYIGIASLSNQPLTIGSPNLEITDQIEQNQLKSPHFEYITVLNRGTLTATNCYLEIEYRTTDNGSYKFLGYSYPSALMDKPIQILPHTQTSFMLVRTMSDNETLETCLMLKEIRDYVDSKNNPINYYYLPVGDYYLKLTAVADNGKSSPREFNLHVLKSENATIEITPVSQ